MYPMLKCAAPSVCYAQSVLFLQSLFHRVMLAVRFSLGHHTCREGLLWCTVFVLCFSHNLCVFCTFLTICMCSLLCSQSVRVLCFFSQSVFVLCFSHNPCFVLFSQSSAPTKCFQPLSPHHFLLRLLPIQGPGPSPHHAPGGRAPAACDRHVI